MEQSNGRTLQNEPSSPISPFQFTPDDELFYENRDNFISDHSLKYCEANFKAGQVV